MLLSGAVRAVPEVERDAVLETVRVARRPALFEPAEGTEAVELHCVRVEDWTVVTIYR